VVKWLHRNNFNTPTRCAVMIAEPSRDWNVFKQIFVDHWDGFKRVYPRYDTGFDHGVGHPLLLLDDAKVPNYRKNNVFNDLGHDAEWPKMADAVIKAEIVWPTAKLFGV
jgi:hypothetical protein